MNIESLNSQITSGYMDRYGAIPVVDEQIRGGINTELLGRVLDAKKYHGCVGAMDYANKNIKSTWKPGWV